MCRCHACLCLHTRTGASTVIHRHSRPSIQYGHHACGGRPASVRRARSLLRSGALHTGCGNGGPGRGARWDRAYRVDLPGLEPQEDAVVEVDDRLVDRGALVVGHAYGCSRPAVWSGLLVGDLNVREQAESAVHGGGELGANQTAGKQGASQPRVWLQPRIRRCSCELERAASRCFRQPYLVMPRGL